ncbi:MAG TPA: hypothetical protein PKC24_10330 [Cyclobacteriaceae bacterium]|nr:hypothetical protein [Cyclobacteriaceae bacterium]
MKIRILIISFMMILLSSCINEDGAPLGEYETFVRYFGTNFNEVAVQVKELSNGDIALLSNTEISATEYKVSLTVTDQFGHRKWNYRGTENNSLRASSFTILPNGNFLITGDEIEAGFSKAMLLELNSAGLLQRTKTFEHPLNENQLPLLSQSANVRGKAITINSSNEIVLLSEVTNNGQDNMLLQSIDANWNEQWSRVYGSDDGSWQPGANVSYVTKRLYLEGVNTVIWGGTVGKNNQADFRLTAVPKDAQSPEFDNSYGTPNSIDEAYDMCRYPLAEGEQTGLGYVIVGRSGTSGSNSNIKLVRTAANGTLIFEKIFGTDRDDFGKAVAPSRDGNLLVFATTQTLAGNSSYYLIKLDNSAEVIWEQLIGSTHNEDAVDITESADGSIILCGTTNIGGLRVAMLMKTTHEGKLF